MSIPFELRKPQEQQLELLSGRDWSDADEPVRFEEGYLRARPSLSGRIWRKEKLSEEELALWREVEPYIDDYCQPLSYEGVPVLSPHQWNAAKQRHEEDAKRAAQQQHVYDWWRQRNGIHGDLSERQQLKAWHWAEHHVRWHHVKLDKPIAPQIAHLPASKTNWRSGSWEFPEYHVEKWIPEKAEDYPDRPEPLEEMPGQAWILEAEDAYLGARDKPRKKAKEGKKAASRQVSAANKAEEAAADRPPPEARVSDEEIEIIEELVASGMSMTEVTDRFNGILKQDGRPPITRPGLSYILRQRR